MSAATLNDRTEEAIAQLQSLGDPLDLLPLLRELSASVRLLTQETVADKMAVNARDGEVAELRAALRWAANTVHQAYHTDEPGWWRTCPRGFCASIRHELRPR